MSSEFISRCEDYLNRRWAEVLKEIEAKMDRARANHISEILFIAGTGKPPADERKIARYVEAEFVSGHNIYIADFFDFASGILILLGESGRIEFLDKIGRELDRGNASITHRKAWARLLRQV